MSETAEIMDQLKREITHGGELKDLPCPLCSLPRSQRSDYIRCSPCGVNWLKGEDPQKDPRLSREPYLSWKNRGGAQSASASTDS